MDKLLLKLNPHKKIVAIFGFGFLLFTFFAILFIDNRWWWSLPVQMCFMHILIKLHKESWFENLIRKTSLVFCIQVASLVMLLFVIPCIFISAWWIFGLLIPIVLYVYSFSLFDSEAIVELSVKLKRRIWLIGLVTYLILLSFYIVPSFIANSHKNPRSSFSSNYANLVVESYVIYQSDSDPTREHIVARSWFVTPENYVNDPVNIIWSNEKANLSRGNLEFGIVPKNSSTEIRDTNNQIVGYKNAKYFMPLDEYKGDVARIMLYMYVTYKDDGLKRSQINVDLMKDWARMDPVDVREIARNQNIQSTYGYNNRFIAFPRLTRFIV